MNSLIIFAVFVMAAYIFQMFLGWQQLKDFNKTYTMLRRLGDVYKRQGRDPRGWVITIAHLVYLPAEAVDLAHAGDDAKEVDVYKRQALTK